MMQLKKKKELNYRRGTVNVCCSKCDNFIKAQRITGIGGRDLGTEPRCSVIGTGSSRRYRVHPASVCNEFDDTMYAARLMGNVALC